MPPRVPYAARFMDFRRYFQSVDPAADELIGAAYWDRQTYLAAGIAQLIFFTQVRGLLRDGNLSLAGTLPDREHALVRSIKIVPIVRPEQRAPSAAAGAAGVPAHPP